MRKLRLIPAMFAGAVALVASLAIPAPAVAYDGGERVVVKSTSAASWTGSVQAAAPRVKHVPQCVDTGCDTVTIKVDLPRWLENKPGGVHVKLQLVGATPDDSVGFVVYDQRKKVVAESSAQVGPARSVLLPSKNARYTAFVYYNPMARELGSPKLTYQAYARFEHQATYPGPVSDLLPDLQALPQRYMTFESPVTFFDDTVSPEYPSCFKSEVEEQGAKLCFRFGQAMANIGQGPMDIRYSTPIGQKPERVPGYQRVYRTDGTYYELPSLGDMEYHPIHSHYHFHDFALSELWLVDGNGNIIGNAPVASGRKNGFCAADTELFWWNPSGPKASVQSFPAPRCLESQSVSNGREYYKHGISRGWADEYWWALPDQMIEVSGLTNGTYALITKVDPENLVREEHDGNNCNLVLVTLSGLTSAQPTATPVANSARSCGNL